MSECHTKQDVFDEEELKWFEKRGCEWMKAEVPKGTSGTAVSSMLPTSPSVGVLSASIDSLYLVDISREPLSPLQLEASVRDC